MITVHHGNATLRLRPGAVIVHGGGYSAGGFDGCSHARNMSSFADIAVALAQRGYL